MIIINPGVRIYGLRPEMVLALVILNAVWAEVGDEKLEVTAVMEGQHKIGSLHYVGQAVDLRSRDLTEAQRAKILEKGRAALGQDFDFFHEGGAAPHFHCEFQPKKAYG